jgi:hypothetical protein
VKYIWAASWQNQHNGFATSMDPDQLSIRAVSVWSGSMLFAISLSTCNRLISKQHVSWSDCAAAQAGLDPCWSQTHFVGFVVTRLIYCCFCFLFSLYFINGSCLWLYLYIERNWKYIECCSSYILYIKISYSGHFRNVFKRDRIIFVV